MKKSNAANLFVKECLTDALFLLMRSQQLETITITQLTEKAGVGRVSFYRNFVSKEDIILKYLEKESESWWLAFQAEENPDVPFWLFKLLDKIKEPLLIVYKSGAFTVFDSFVNKACGPKPEHSNYEAYTRAIITGSFIAWVGEWMKRGMKEDSQDIYQMFSKQIN